MQFHHELLLDLHERMMESDAPRIIKALQIITPQEYYQHCKMHIETFANALYFRDENLLYRYLQWRYRTYHFHWVDTALIDYENQRFKELVAFYLDDANYFRISTLFNQIESWHKELCLKPQHTISIKYPYLDTQLYTHALQGESQKLFETLDKKSPSLEHFCTFCDKHIAALMRRIGKEWEHNTISIAQEHLVCATINKALERLLDVSSSTPSYRGHILLATPPNEHHNLGLTIASYILRQLKYKVTQLEANLSIEAIQKRIELQKPNYVIFSVTLANHLHTLDTLLKSISNNNLTTVVSGNALHFLDHPSQSLHCDRVVESFHALYKIFNQ
jgi:methanogenic corrinoid protein MtbC1